MKRGTIVLGFFAIIAAAIVGVSLFLENRPPLTIRVAVDPLAQDWMQQMVTDFNAKNMTIKNGTLRVQIDLEAVSDLDVWGSSSDIGWDSQNHPDAWIPALPLSIEYAPQPFLMTQLSVAQTPLVFAGYASRVDVLTDSDLDWAQIFRAGDVQSWEVLGGEANWRFFSLAFPLPDSKVSGLGVLYSGLAALSQNPTLTGQLMRNVRDDFQPVVESVPNFNSIGNDVAAFMARTPASADVGIGPEKLWIQQLSGLVDNEAVRFSYPEYSFMFDFPYAVWNAPETDPDQLEAANVFGEWLVSDEAQARVTEYGLRPVSGIVTATDRLFAAAEQYGIQFEVPVGRQVQPPDINDTRAMFSWFQSIQ